MAGTGPWRAAPPATARGISALHRDGRTLSIEFSIQLLRAPDGSVAGSAAVIRDVTARFERDKALRLRLAELEAKAGKG